MNKPNHWKDLPDHEQEALIEFARLPKEQRRRIYKAGSNIAWWDGLIERAGNWKVILVICALFAGWITGFFDAIAAAWMGIGQ